MGGPSSPRIGVSKAKDLPRIFTITDSPSEIHAATLRKSFLKSATFAVFMRAGNTTFQRPSTPIQSHPCHTDEPPNPQANLIPDLLTRIPLPIHLHPQLRLLPPFFQPPPPITLSSSQSNARRGSPPAIRQALQRRLLRPSQRRRSPPPAPPGRSLRPHPIGPTPAHPRLFPRGTNIQLAAIPFDAIRGTPEGIFVLRALKAEPIGRLLDNAVSDNNLLSHVSRRLFDRFIPCVFDRTDPIDRPLVFRRIQGVRNHNKRLASTVCPDVGCDVAAKPQTRVPPKRSVPTRSS